MLDSLSVYQEIEASLSDLLSQLSSVEECELLESFNKIERDKVLTLQGLILNSLDLSGKAKITIKKDVFAELDALRTRYENLDSFMTEML